MMNNRLLAALAIVCIPAIWPTSAMGQAPAESGWVRSYQLLVGEYTPDGFIEPDCSQGVTVGLGLRITRRIHPGISISLDLPVLLDPMVGTCTIDYIHSEPPFNDLDVRSPGQPVLAPSGFISFEPWTSLRFLTPALNGGVGYFVGSGTPFLLVGATAFLGDRSRKHLFVEWNRFFADTKVRFRLREMDGDAVIQEESFSRRRDVDRNFFRVGMRLPTR